jgi:hypothetical protein
MIKRILAAAFLIAFPALANAQFAEPIQGPFLTGAPPAGFSGFNINYNCSIAVTNCAGGVATPVVQVLNAAPLGPQIPGASVGVVLTPTQVSTDPCTLGGGVGGSISKIGFNVTGTGTLQIAAPQPSPPAYVYLCTLDVNTVAAATVNLTGGLGATCATGSPTTLAGPMSFPALALWQKGNGGATVYRVATAGHGVCISASTGVITASGTLVQQ